MRGTSLYDVKYQRKGQEVRPEKRRRGRMDYSFDGRHSRIVYWGAAALAVTPNIISFAALPANTHNSQTVGFFFEGLGAEL